MAAFSKLQALHDRVRDSHYSSFYRDLWGASSKTPETLKEWESLPLLQKSHIARVPYHDRIFIDPAEVDVVRLTSGTSSSGVLAIPRAKMSYTEAEHTFMPVDNFMGFLIPHRVYDNYARPGARFIGGDPARLAESAALAAKMEIQGIGALPSTLIAFAGPLAATYDITRVTHLCFNGDSATPLQRTALRKLYPGVRTAVSCYGSSETQGLCGVTTEHPGHENALLGHPSVHYELVGDDGRTIHETPAEGELVASILYEQAAFPLVRYRTGDRALMLERKDERTVFSILGRAASDRVRFAAGVILLSELERAVDAASGGLALDFEATVGETISGSTPVLTLSIAIIVSPQYAASIPREFARRFEQELRVSEHGSYAVAIGLGYCRPVEYYVHGPEYAADRKRRRLTDARKG